MMRHGGPRRRTTWRGVFAQLFPEAALAPCLWLRLTGDAGPRGQVLALCWLLAAESEAPRGNPALPWPSGLGFWERVSLSVDGDSDAYFVGSDGSFEVWPSQHLDRGVPGPSSFPCLVHAEPLSPAAAPSGLSTGSSSDGPHG